LHLPNEGGQFTSAARLTCPGPAAIEIGTEGNVRSGKNVPRTAGVEKLVPPLVETKTVPMAGPDDGASGVAI